VPGGFTSPDPNRRLDAIIEAARSDDPAAIRSLIVQLDSADAAARILAIRTLEDLTGETFGYDPYSGDIERGAAVDRWTRWERERRAGTVTPRRRPPETGVGT